MDNNTEEIQLSEEQIRTLLRVGIIVVLVTAFLLVGIMIWHAWSVKRPSNIVLPAGQNYLGPTPTDEQAQAPAAAAAPAGDKFTVTKTTTWKTITGNKYAYSFSSPSTLKLVTFPNDPYDIYAISWNNIAPQSSVLIGVDNLKNNENLKQYINSPKIAYVENWWKQFGTLKGVGPITPFTNSNGLKGYKAKYLTQGGQSPVDDVFMEVPDHPEFVIHLSNGVLEQTVFDKVIDTVNWVKNGK